MNFKKKSRKKKLKNSKKKKIKKNNKKKLKKKNKKKSRKKKLKNSKKKKQKKIKKELKKKMKNIKRTTISIGRLGDSQVGESALTDIYLGKNFSEEFIIIIIFIIINIL